MKDSLVFKLKFYLKFIKKKQLYFLHILTTCTHIHTKKLLLICFPWNSVAGYFPQTKSLWKLKKSALCHICCKHLCLFTLSLKNPCLQFLKIKIKYFALLSSSKLLHICRSIPDYSLPSRTSQEATSQYLRKCYGIHNCSCYARARNFTCKYLCTRMQRWYINV